MNKDEWISKPAIERKQWYLQEISQLIDILNNDGDSDTNGRLKTIKMRMAFDNTPSDERAAHTQEDYYRTIYKAYKALPNFDMEQQNWPAALLEAKELISELDN